jgi:thiamine pyrophosphokinase
MRIEAPAGGLLTLLPLGGDAIGVRTAGLRYALDGETLAVGRSRGLSNVVVEQPASVSLEGGSLLAIETTEEGDHS